MPPQPAQRVGPQPVDQHELGKLLARRLDVGDQLAVQAPADDDLLEPVTIATHCRNDRCEGTAQQRGEQTSPSGGPLEEWPNAVTRRQRSIDVERRNHHRVRSPQAPEHPPVSGPALGYHIGIIDLDIGDTQADQTECHRQPVIVVSLQPRPVQRGWLDHQAVVGFCSVRTEAAELGTQVAESIALLGTNEPDATDAGG